MTTCGFKYKYEVVKAIVRMKILGKVYIEQKLDVRWRYT